MAERPASAFDDVDRAASEAGAPWSEPAIAAALPGLAVLLGLVLSGRGQDLLPSPARMAIVLAWPIVLLLVAKTGRVWIAAVFLVAAGFLLRWVDFWHGGGSDVLNAVDEALRTFFAGGSPYNHYYLTTRPPGSLMPYPPGQLLLHFPGWFLGGFDGVRLTEFVAAIVGMTSLAWLAVRRAPTVGLVGLALYAGLPNLINLTSDGGNDTSAGVVVLVAILVMAWAADRKLAGLSAVAAGAAVGFTLATKQSTLLFAIALSLHVLFAYRPALLRYVAGLAYVMALVSIPFLLIDPVAYVHGVATTATHDIQVYGWNYSVMLQGIGWNVPDGTTAGIINAIVTLAMLGVVATLAARGVAEAAVAGLLATLAAFLTAQWTTYSYFALVLAPLAAIPALVTWELRSRRGAGGILATE
ncbi:MAG TPA: hypothetical protein VIK06_01005 [Candidatus Limnocylindrales bacterium]